jgi:protoporphyrinogen oxidase
MVLSYSSSRVNRTVNGEQFVVVGGGISGLAAACSLRKVGIEPVVLEACPSEGGLTRTIKIDNFCFDYTGHLLHLAEYDSPSGIPFANLNDTDWQRIERRSFCLVDGELVTAPIQYNLRELKDEKLRACMESYYSRPLLPQSSKVSFRDFLISGFGPYLSDLFLIPQNEKTWAIDLDRISLSAGKRFFPMPDEDKVISGAIQGRRENFGYNSCFWYPKQGGIELLVSGLSKSVNDIHFFEEVTAVDIQGHNLVTKKGNSFKWDILISSIPLKRLCEITNDRELNDHSKSLSHSSTIVINIGLRKPVPETLENIHWVYIPGKELPFYRVGIYSNISKEVCPKDCAAMYVELGLAAGDSESINVSSSIVSRSMRALSDLGWIDLDSVVCVVCHRIPCAYAHFTPERELNLPKILDRLNSFNIYPIGRYGLWDYMSMEDSILSGMRTIEQVTRCNIV